jgi:peptidyl-prolyl cis-trans isomerase SDCCAG10
MAAHRYIFEPPTRGKVILLTDSGDIEIELFSKEAPKACRNFVQLCLEGYFDHTVFHRIIKGFLVQGGDRSGSGEGGESIYNGKPFASEFHSRLRYYYRGLVGCAHGGRGSGDFNTSQFFITLDKAEELNRKHTLFGKVVGDTIYNVLRMQERDIGEEDRPLYPPVILSTQVIMNPFEDLVPRWYYPELEKQKIQKFEEKPIKPIKKR